MDMKMVSIVMNTSTGVNFEGRGSLRSPKERTDGKSGEAIAARANTACSPIAEEAALDPWLVEALTVDLATLLDLHLRYKVYEWTVGGPSWFVYRSLFVDLGGAVAKSIDLVADRIVGLGGAISSNLRHQSTLSCLSLRSDVADTPEEMIADALKAERALVVALARNEDLVREHNDYLTEDLLKHLSAKHNRHIRDLWSRCEAGSIGRKQ